MESLIKSIQLDPNLIEAHLFLGQIFFRDQDFGKAARHFQAVLRVRPKDPTALIGLAECQIQMSDARGAIELLRRGQDNYGDDPLFLIREAYVQEVLLNDIGKAIEIYRTVQRGYQDGTFKRELGFNLGQRILDLEMSVKGNRALAGSKASEVIK
jgi:tetratricopeptide (TPR) repeat protein